MQQAFATIPGPPEGRGLYQQSDQVQYNLIYFQQQLNNQVSREALYLAFDRVDSKLEPLLGELQGFEKWDAAIRMTGRRVRAAEQDLHFALFTGDGNPS